MIDAPKEKHIKREKQKTDLWFHDKKKHIFEQYHWLFASRHPNEFSFFVQMIYLNENFILMWFYIGIRLLKTSKKKKIKSEMT